MKIAIFADNFLPQINGVVVSVLTKAKGLADRGHKIYIFAPKYNTVSNFRYPNIKVIRTPSIPAKLYPDLRVTAPISPRIINKVIKEKIQLIHFDCPMALGWQAVLIAKTLKIPLVGTYHTIFSDMQYLKHAKMDYKFFEKIAWKYAQIVYNTCDLITCPSEATKKELLKHNFKRKIKFISNGVDPSIFDNKKAAQIKKKYKIKGKLLLHVGRIAHEKSIKHLVRAFNIVVRRRKDVTLMLVGDGPQFNEIKKTVKDLSLEDHVIMTGSIPHDKLVKSGIFGATDLFVITSKTETGPITVLEAQANGIVCIGVKARNIPYIIKDNVNGLVVKPDSKTQFADAVLKVLGNKKLYDRMKKATLRLIKEHDVAKVIEQWEKIYTKMITSTSNRRR